MQTREFVLTSGHLIARWQAVRVEGLPDGEFGWLPLFARPGEVIDQMPVPPWPLPPIPRGPDPYFDHIGTESASFVTSVIENGYAPGHTFLGQPLR